MIIMLTQIRIRTVLAIFWAGIALVILQSIPAHAVEKAKIPVDLSTAIIQVAKQNIPAVVHIEVTERQEVVNPLLPFESDPFSRRFFDIPKMPRKFKRELKGLGTGMIIDSQGHILTNHHVAGGATKIEVLLSNGQRYPAKLVGTDPKTDLAVIHVSAEGTSSLCNLRRFGQG
jgi:S1-C subfamily serine protease